MLVLVILVLQFYFENFSFQLNFSRHLIFLFFYFLAIFISLCFLMSIFFINVYLLF